MNPNLELICMFLKAIVYKFLLLFFEVSQVA